MLKPIHWKTFPRDFAIAQLGFALYGLAIALIIQAGLGTGPWAVLSVALAELTNTTPGTMIVVTGLLVLLAAVLMKEKVGWGTLGNILFIGPWTDLFLLLVPSLKGNPWLQIPGLLGAVVLTGIATAVYLSVNAGAGPRDSLMLAVSRVSGRSVRLSRAVIEILVVVVGWFLDGPVGIGTLLFAVSIGPLVQFFFKLFHVRPHEPVLEG
ncbi:MAG: YczE/YyaS/YitT family protein [Anaerolineales bacterium]